MRQRGWYAAGAAGVMALLAGCGGGNNPATISGSDAGTTAGATPATRTRTIGLGDTWVYAVNVRGQFNGDGEDVATVAREIPGDGQVVYSSQLRSGMQSLIRTYGPITQDAATGDVSVGAFVYDQAKKEGNYQPRFFLPGTWNQNTSRTYMVGDTTYTFTVEGKDTVETPVLRFQTWRVRQTATTPDGKTVGTYWYAPEVGNFVKADFTTTYDSGRTFTYTYQLKSTTVLAGGLPVSAE